MTRSRSKPVLVSKREWLRQRLLARLREVKQAIVKDAALKLLAEEAARRLSGGGLGYGELTHAMASVGKVMETLAAVDRGAATKPISAAELKRLRQTGRLPSLPPWF